MQSPSRWKTNAFIAALLSLLVIEGLPTWYGWQLELRNLLLPLSRRLGIEQNGWQLYAPDPDNWNLRISATLTYPDGAVRQWHSPDWATESSWRKMRLARHINYYEFLVQTDSYMYWPSFADELWRTAERLPGGLAPARIELTQHWAEIPPPAKGINWQTIPAEIPFTWHEPFFVKEYP